MLPHPVSNSRCGHMNQGGKSECHDQYRASQIQAGSYGVPFLVITSVLESLSVFLSAKSM